MGTEIGCRIVRSQDSSFRRPYQAPRWLVWLGIAGSHRHVCWRNLQDRGGLGSILRAVLGTRSLQAWGESVNGEWEPNSMMISNLSKLPSRNQRSDRKLFAGAVACCNTASVGRGAFSDAARPVQATHILPREHAKAQQGQWRGNPAPPLLISPPPPSVCWKFQII